MGLFDRGQIVRHTAELRVMTSRIDRCIYRHLKDRPYMTRIKLAEDEWIVKGTGFG